MLLHLRLAITTWLVVLHHAFIRLSLLEGKFNTRHGTATPLRVLFTHVNVPVRNALPYRVLSLRLLHVFLESFDAPSLQDQLSLVLCKDLLLRQLRRGELPLQVSSTALFELESVWGAHSDIALHEFEVYSARISLDVLDKLLVEWVFLGAGVPRRSLI